jgi:hypothetical protein
MTVLIEDTVRNNLVKWAIDGVAQGAVAGAVLSPFSTARVGNNYKPSGAEIVGRLRDGGVTNIWFDPVSHALQMPSVGDFRHYDSWGLWDGQRGATAFADYRSHCERVFAIQDDLELPRLAPTILLDNPTSQLSALSLRVARWAVDDSRATEKDIFLTVAGTSAFWSAGGALDAHVGGLAQLSPNGWFAVQGRPNTTFPVQTTPQEVFGLCRTARSLGEDQTFHVSHGDFAALPAMAAGASSIGTGWDTRQRVCASTSYVTRGDGEGGGWFKRPTLLGLLGFVSRQEAELLANQNAALAAQLIPGTLHPDAPEEAFLHHAQSLQQVISGLPGDYRGRYEYMRDLYQAASGAWPQVTAITHSPSDESTWVTPFLEGLTLYGQSEGW